MDSESEAGSGLAESITGDLVLPPRALLPAPLGGDPASVRLWFDAAAIAHQPVPDGTLAGERNAADAYARMAKAANTRRAYRAAVRAWCTWCDRHDLPPLPGRGAEVAAFLAGERGRKLTPNTIDLRRAAIRYLHHAAGCPVPTDDACVSETVAGIRRDAARKNQLPKKKVAATAGIVRRLLAPIGSDLRGLRDRAVILVGFAGALRRAELAAIRVEHLEPTERGIKLTLPRTKGEQTGSVTVPLPYGDTELCPVHALALWQQAAGITEGPVFRRIWPPRPGQAAAPEARPPLPPQPFQRLTPPEPWAKPTEGSFEHRLMEGSAEGAPPRIGPDAITPQTVALIVQSRAVAAGFQRRDLGGHSLKRGALTTGMERGVHPAALKRLGRHKSFDVLGEYLEFGDLFDGHPLSGVL